MRYFLPVVSQVLGLLLVFYSSMAIAEDAPLTVREVAKDLACPCQCPLILQDCNMTCGLTWKEEIGQLISQGKTKQEISGYFIAKYGEAARLTPLQKVYGKIYQYTRGFDTKEWVFLWSAVATWTVLLFVMLYLVVKRFLARSKSA